MFFQLMILNKLILPLFILSKAIIYHLIEGHQLYPNPTIFDFINFLTSISHLLVLSKWIHHLVRDRWFYPSPTLLLHSLSTLISFLFVLSK